MARTTKDPDIKQRKLSSPTNVTVSVNDLLGVLAKSSISDRVSLASSLGGQKLLSALTPTELANIFPDYYKRADPDVSGFIKATSRRYGGIPAGQEYTEKAKAYEGPDIKGVADPGMTQQKQQKHKQLQETSALDRIQKDLGLKIDSKAALKLSAEEQSLIDRIKSQGGVSVDDPNISWLKSLPKEAREKAGITEKDGKFVLGPTKEIKLDEKQKAIYEFSKEFGANPQAIAGVLGVESELNPSAQGGAGHNYHGIFQLQRQQIAGLTEKAGFGKLTPDEYKKLSFQDQLKVMKEYYKQAGISGPGFFTGDKDQDAARAWALQLAPSNAKSIDYTNPNAIITGPGQATEITVGRQKGAPVTVGSAPGSNKRGANILPEFPEFKSAEEILAEEKYKDQYSSPPDYASPIVKENWKHLTPGQRQQLSSLPEEQLKGGKGEQAISEMTGTKTGKIDLFNPVSAGSLSGRPGSDSASMGKGKHQGVDMMTPRGSTVFAAGEGVITKIGKDNFQQPTITIRHPDGTYSRYLHMGRVDMKVGDPVKGGQPIGTSGSANGVDHLHFERWRNEPNGAGNGLIDPRKEMGWDDERGRGRPVTGGIKSVTSEKAPPTDNVAVSKEQQKEQQLEENKPFLESPKNPLLSSRNKKPETEAPTAPAAAPTAPAAATTSDAAQIQAIQARQERELKSVSDLKPSGVSDERWKQMVGSAFNPSRSAGRDWPEKYTKEEIDIMQGIREKRKELLGASTQAEPVAPAPTQMAAAATAAAVPATAESITQTIKSQAPIKTPTQAEATKTATAVEAPKVEDQQIASVEALGGSIPGSENPGNIKAFPIKTDLKVGQENVALVDTSKDKAKMLAAVNSGEKLTYQDDKIHVKSKVNPQELEPQKKDNQPAQENQGQEPMAMSPQAQNQNNFMDRSHMEDIKSGKINPSTGHYMSSAMERHYNITRNFRDLTDGHFDSAASNHT